MQDLEKKIHLKWFAINLFALQFSKALFFLILGLRIFFLKILRSEEGKKKTKKNTIFFLLFNLKHIWIREKKITKIV